MESVNSARQFHDRAWIASIFVWAVWGAMAIASIVFIRHYSRNIPYMDDFTLVPIMTGHEPVSLRWLWSQHNEHRPVVSRLIMVGLYRFISSDFRLGMYVNAALLSAAAASMIVLARRLRGHTRWFDVALPLSILNIGQAETLLLGLAMALMLTSWITCELIGLALIPEHHRRGWPVSIKLGLYLVLLPLCGGSGLVMLPPLVVWLASVSIWGSGPERSGARATFARWLGLGLLIVCLVIVGFYFYGYRSPVHHHGRPTPAAASATTLEYLSLVILPNMGDYWRLAGCIVVFLVAATLARLFWVGWRQPAERSRAFAMVAVILAMLCAALAVGVSRSFMGPGGGSASRYITTTAPLYCALYIAWLVHGSARTRRLVPALLLALIVVAIPANLMFSREYGHTRREIFGRLERLMKSHSSISVVVRKAWPELHPVRDIIDMSFRMLKEARVGRFGDLGDDTKEIIGYLDSPSDDQTVTGILPVVGWIADPTGPGAVIEVTVNDRALSNPVEEVARPDVEAALPSNSGRRVVTGFRATFDTSQFPDGAHRFSCVVRKFGEEKVIASRTIRTRNGRANLAEAPNTSKAIR